jgi:hypothetical protein
MVSKLGFFSGTSFLLSTSMALKWPAKTIVEEGDYEEAKEQRGCRSSMVQENIEHPWYWSHGL